MRKGSKEPVKFCDIDDEICAHLGVTPHPTLYYEGWYDVIGMCIACGKALGSRELYEHLQRYSPRLLPVLAYLVEHYTSDAWYQVR
jgi:hypothetical protein